MQKEVKDKLGLGCSIGVSYNKFLAKMGSDLNKPMGFTIIRNKDVSTLIWPLKIANMYGVGKKTAPRLIEIGINTIGDLANYDDIYTLKAILGKNYIFYKENCNEEDIEACACVFGCRCCCFFRQCKFGICCYRL